MADSSSTWATRRLGELAVVGSGEYPPNSDGSEVVMGANGPIGSTSRTNFGPGYLVGRVGAAGAVKKIQGRCWASDNTLTVEPLRKHSDMAFLGHLLVFLRPEKLATVTAQPLITQTNLSSLEALIPINTLEQRRIAEILDTVDEAIRRTEQVIEKLQQMKQGLLHDLLTRGIDENGELRPPPEKAPHLYKDSPLGLIPVGWSIKPVQMTATLQRGLDLPIQDRKVGDIPVFGSNGVDGYHDGSPFSGPGVITGRSGSIGGVHYCEGPYWPLNTTLYVKDFHGNDRRWIAHLLRFLHLERLAAATGVPSLNRNFVHPILVRVPNRREQIRQVALVQTINDKIMLEDMNVHKLRTLKKGLMDDLLTGRVRVKQSIGEPQ